MWVLASSASEVDIVKMEKVGILDAAFVSLIPTKHKGEAPACQAGSLAEFLNCTPNRGSNKTDPKRHVDPLGI